MSSSPPILRGLTAGEADRRLAADGPNALPADRRRLWAVLLSAVREPMFLLLLAADALYFALGDLHEALLLLFMVSITIGLTLYQEGKTERALAALRDLSSPRALVLRDGKPVRIPGTEVVRGDLLVLAEGDRVAADAVLVAATALEADESLLTGEAWSVRKRFSDAREDERTEAARPGGDDLPWVWSGTLIVRGDGIARVTATGPRSELGKIGSALRELGEERSPLQRESVRTIRMLAVAGVVLSAAMVGLYGLLRGEWLQAVLVGIALAMSLLPEEYPVILAVFPAIGAWRMARAQVLTRRLSAIETLGSITVLCTDKTGTLTGNRMEVACIDAGDGSVVVAGNASASLPADAVRVAQMASLASKPRAFDPMENAIHRLAGQLGDLPGVQRERGPLREYPLSTDLRAMSMVWRRALGGDDGCIVAAKGAPEAVARLCRLAPSDRRTMLDAADRLAEQGLRVLAVAEANEVADAQAARLPEAQEQFDFRYLGLLALADPLRAEIPEAMRQCAEAGVRVIMITGDYPATARNIAAQAGMAPGELLEGGELDLLDDAALAARLRGVAICARITPAQKLRIVQALKANGEVVAMTGDGVNDAPALKAAHVGIAMGGRGTDVAREAASLVLLDDNFASIVRGISHGRRIFANMRNAMSYVLSMHVPIAGMALLPALLGWPILLYPMQIAFLELIIDPACSLAFENEPSDREAMRRPPRTPQSPLLDRTLLLRSALQGVASLAVVAAFYAWAIDRLPEAEARAGAFAVLVVANVMLIFSDLAGQQRVLSPFRSPNRIAMLVSALAFATLIVTLYAPGVALAFHFAPLGFGDMAVALAVGSTSVVWYELLKRFGPRHVDVG